MRILHTIIIFSTCASYAGLDRYQISVQKSNHENKFELTKLYEIGNPKSFEIDARITLNVVGFSTVQTTYGLNGYSEESREGYFAWGLGMEGKRGNKLKYGIFGDIICNTSALLPSTPKFRYLQTGLFGEYWLVESISIGPLISYSKTIWSRSEIDYPAGKRNINLDGLGLGINMNIALNESFATNLIDGLIFTTFSLLHLFPIGISPGP